MKEFNEVVKLAERLYSVDLSKLALIVKNLGRSSAGSAEKDEDNNLTICLNSQALDLHGEFTRTQIIPHEVAHIVNFLLPETGKAHNQGWRDVCSALGGNPNTTCKLVGMKSTRKWLYRSDCGNDVILTTVRHNRINKGKVYTINNSYDISKRHFIQEIEA